MILIVDDHADTRRAMHYLLKSCGRRSYGVADGAEALAYLESHDGVHCVILDFYMPGGDGLELLRTIRRSERLRRLRVIVYSVDGGTAKRLSLEAGADAFVLKTSLDWVDMERFVSTLCDEPPTVESDTSPDAKPRPQRSAG